VRQKHGLRLNARELALVLGREQGGSDESQEGATRLVIGTRPSPTNSIWKHWESAGFKVAVVTSPHSNRPHRQEPLPHEEGDKALTDYLLKTAEDLLLLQTHGGREQGETLVLCIGKSLERFREIIRTAVRIGWKVEIGLGNNGILLFPSPCLAILDNLPTLKTPKLSGLAEDSCKSCRKTFDSSCVKNS
jgi:hypothetical protein